MKSKKGKMTTQVTIVVMILIALVVGYYCYLVNRSGRSADEKKMTALEKVLLRDLEYHEDPPTPREMIRYYNEIIKCFYNENCSKEELEALGLKARELYDQELLDHKDWDTYIFNLEAEVQDFQDNNRKISNISLASSLDVDEFTQDGYKFAKIRCGYNILQGRESSSSVQVYLLRKDQDGRWKIYGWDLAENLQEGNYTDER